jgi:hypothetical protein
MRKDLESEQRLGGGSETTKAGKIEDGGGSGVGAGQESLDRIVEPPGGKVPLPGYCLRRFVHDCLGLEDRVDDLAAIHGSDPLQ